MIPLYNNDTVRRLEAKAIEAGTNAYLLMQRAGAAAFKILCREWPTVNSLVIFAGSGNNAGDGLVIARLAKEAGFQVTVYLMGEPGHLSGSAATACAACESSGISLFTFSKDLRLTVNDQTLMIDALLGSGMKGEIRSDYAAVIRMINELRTPVLAIDVPSGLNVETGLVSGKEAVIADITITFIAHKKGLYTASAKDYVGRLFQDNLLLPDYLFEQVSTDVFAMGWQDVSPILPPRQHNSYKGYYGHVLVIGGNDGMGGAVRLSGEAALRVGAGVVTVLTRPEHVAIVSGQCPELMCRGVNKGDDLSIYFKRASVVVIGPGLGAGEWAVWLFNELIQQTDCELVIDADALKLLSSTSFQANRWVLTPHPGEAASLLGTTTQTIQANRYSAVTELQKKYQGVAVLKGSGSLIRTRTEETFVCTAGNPGMATAGMGDVLTGVIAGLIAQKLNSDEAAKAGVLLHAMAGDRAASLDGQIGLKAMDLLPHLRHLVNWSSSQLPLRCE